MKNTLYSLLAVLLIPGLSIAAMVSFDVNQTIPDNDPIGIQNSQTLSGYSGAIVSLQVELVISPLNFGGWTGDYFVTLQHDSGFSVLLNRPGVVSGDNLGYGDNGFNMVFDEGGDDVHLYQSFAFSLDGIGALIGTWSPDGRVTDPLSVLETDPRPAALSSFTGLDPNGLWTLFVADNNFNGDGQLVSWGLNVNTTSIPEPSTLGLLATGLLLFLRRKKSA